MTINQVELGFDHFIVYITPYDSTNKLGKAVIAFSFIGGGSGSCPQFCKVLIFLTNTLTINIIDYLLAK